MRSNMRWLLCVLVLVGSAAACAAGSAADARRELAAMFGAGLKNTPPAIAEARQHAARLRDAHPGDARIYYAYGLVLANQRRYGDALTLISRYLQAQPDDAGALGVKLWVELQDKRFDAALETAAALAEHLPPPRNAQEQAAGSQIAKLLGSVFGYLELTRPGSVGEQQLGQQKNALVARLGETYLSAFDEGRQRVGAELSGMEAQRDARLKRAQEIVDARKQQTETALSQSRERVEAQRATIQSSAEQLQDAQRELAVIQNQLATLANDRTQLAAQIATVQASLQALDSTTYSSKTTTEGTGRNLYETRRTDVKISYENYVQAAALAVTLAGLNQQAFDLDRQILDLQTRAAQLGGKGQREAQTLAQSQAIATDAAKRAGRLEKQLARVESSVRPRPAAPSGRMTVFSTYVPLPYQQESERVLGWFAP
jgi:hypothetical protein